MFVVEAVSLWENRRVFQGLWEGGGAGDVDSHNRELDEML
jgi:hypothetical protein